MPRRITIQPRLSLEELENRYRQAKDPVERSHYQIIWLLAQGRPSEEVAFYYWVQPQLDLRTCLGIQQNRTRYAR